jgi:hypothetical protein
MDLQAIRKSKRRWHPRNPRRGEVPDCGLCERWFDQPGKDPCTGCPLRAKWGARCDDPDQPWTIWWALRFDERCRGKDRQQVVAERTRLADRIYADLTLIEQEYMAKGHGDAAKRD